MNRMRWYCFGCGKRKPSMNAQCTNRGACNRYPAAFGWSKAESMMMPWLNPIAHPFPRSRKAPQVEVET